MAFHLNTVKFNTTYLEELRILAGRFHNFLFERHSALKSALGHRAASMDPTKLGEAISRHPILVPTIEEIKQKGRIPTLASGLILDALRAHLPHDELPPQASKNPLRDARQSIEELVSFEINPWDIPLECEFDDILKDAAWVDPDKRAYAYERCLRIDNGKYRFSAAATAIYFLHRIIPETRCLIQNILIYEDYRSVAFPECHALGLIPFCQENPSLRIIQRASLWGNIFLSSTDEPSWQKHLLAIFHCRIVDPPPADSLPLGEIIQTVAVWMSEAGILASMGMPASQFTLLMDGDPFPEKASEIFRKELQEAALLQETVSKAPRFGHWCSYVERVMDHFLFDDFPRLLADLSNNWESGMIQCNFNPGTSIGSPDEILATHPDWGWQEWEYELWDYFEDREDAELPGFDQMALHNNMIESYCQKYPNGRPRHAMGGAPDWNDDGNPGDSDDPEQADDSEEADAHEADV
ncbi:unnamed protein product [Clonostachys rosea]|uniref:Uncharacterized protein n=1 Tax=Bionectria ochroleuca TaxID=29856 RepID=A0ABY6UGF1_BIOOC|nr:unnamed protein product [Clonostachys rosea]